MIHEKELEEIEIKINDKTKKWDLLTQEEKTWVEESGYSKDDVEVASLPIVINFLKLQYAYNKRTLGEVNEMIKRLREEVDGFI